MAQSGSVWKRMKMPSEAIMQFTAGAAALAAVQSQAESLSLQSPYLESMTCPIAVQQSLGGSTSGLTFASSGATGF